MGVEARYVEGGRMALAEGLRALLTRRVTGPEAVQLATFARQLLARATGPVTALAEEELAAMVYAAFRFFSGPGPEVRVRAVTPTYATEGWDATVSIVETCLSDRPFIVDTIREELRAQGVEVATLLHPIFATQRDATGALESLGPPNGREGRESFLHVVIPRIPDQARLAALADAVRARLEDVCVVTDDFAAMVGRAHALATQLEQLGRTRGARLASDATGAADFLRWLVDGGFVFLGYREYGIVESEGRPALQLRAGTGLGLLRREERSAFVEPRPLDALPEPVRARLAAQPLLTVVKAGARAPVHHRVFMEDVAFGEVDTDGRLTGARRFLGLFTSKAYAEEAGEIPVLRRMLRQILAAEQVTPGSHDWKEIVGIFNTFPKGELFASAPTDVLEDIRTIIAAASTDEVVVAVRQQPRGRRVSVLALMPARRISGEARARVADLVAVCVGGTLIEDHLEIAGDRARLHLAFRCERMPLADVELDALREAVGGALGTWEDRLALELEERHGTEEGERLAGRWARAFPDDYKVGVGVERAATDVGLLEASAATGAPQVALDDEAGGGALRCYAVDAPLVLADFLPLLEDLGLRTLTEDRVAARAADGRALFVHRFLVQDRHGHALDVEAVGPRLREALLAVWTGRTESDVLNRLVLEAGLDWRAVECLRAYAGHGVQAGLGARDQVLAALADHPVAAAALFACFTARFRPAAAIADARDAFVASLDGVQSLRQDALLRALAATVEATVRTTFFTRGPDVRHLAFKIHSAVLGHLPSPRPLYEVYVRGPGVEGIHVRAGLVARGGIRLSDRPEDYRTEVLGLMKTQTVKNALIVPTGAKGAFVVRDGTPPIDGYAIFIRGLLDVTDNLVAGTVVHPIGLLVYDQEDPYLVVAADKGTARFSDVANAIAAEYGFWLGDAFASGGSHGYDHKALGITARGAWECVRTHFRELGLDADHAPLTVIGIGDMSGDVFGNGLLRSRQLRLRAVFDHRHVLIDPEPDPERSFVERERLFRVGLGWDAYDPSALSTGWVFAARSAKRVMLTQEARRLLGIAEESLSGEALVRAVLGLDADLLWNGGIGTYVRAPDETDAMVGDPANNAVRVDATALRVRVVAEGGNLGFTQRARIVYALGGGHIDTDAVDNSGGVDMSDHEVNLKVCLAPVVRGGTLSPAERDALLLAVQDDVVVRVLDHNRSQSRALTIDQVRSRTRLVEFREHAADLEHEAGLDRVLEGVPDYEALRARRAAFRGLTRPELAVLMAYTKIRLQTALLASPLVDDPLLERHLLEYFPRAIVERHPDAVRSHRLRREIVAVVAAGELVDHLGVTFVHRVARDTGATPATVLRAWAIAWAALGGAPLAREIAACGLSLDDEIACLLALEGAAERTTKWLLAHGSTTGSAAAASTELADALGRVRPRIGEWVGGLEAEAFQKRVSELEIGGLPAALARELVTAEWLPGALDVIMVAQELGLSPEDAARRYWALGQQLDFAWLLARLGEDESTERWQRRAAEGLVEDLRAARRQLAGVPPETLATAAVGTLQELLRDLRGAPRVGLPGLVVAVREVRRLADALRPAATGEGG